MHIKTFKMHENEEMVRENEIMVAVYHNLVREC